MCQTSGSLSVDRPCYKPNQCLTLSPLLCRFISRLLGPKTLCEMSTDSFCWGSLATAQEPTVSLIAHRHEIACPICIDFRLRMLALIDILGPPRLVCALVPSFPAPARQTRAYLLPLYDFASYMPSRLIVASVASLVRPARRACLSTSTTRALRLPVLCRLSKCGLRGLCICNCFIYKGPTV